MLGSKEYTSRNVGDYEWKWERAFQAVKEQFEIDNLLPEQENSLPEFLVDRNIFVNLPTAYGKSFR